MAGHPAFSAGVTPAPDLPLVSGTQLQEKLDKSKIPVVLDFWATWCVPCKIYGPVVAEVSRTYKNKMAFYRVDASDFSNDKLVQKYSLQSLPVVLVVVKGEIVERWEGALKKEDLQNKLDKALAHYGKSISK
ncbi:MAG TPA: thioredoxin family protein [bacterium]|nr:thioredoxin family protein [bacterium]